MKSIVRDKRYETFKDIKEYLNNNVQYDAGLFSKKVNELNPQIKINFYNEIISWKKEKRN